MDARSAASRAGIPYYVVDFEESFHKEVISKFVDSYAAGETPNPCIDCNNRVKFKELRKRAAAMGCSHVATGHYARIESSTEGYRLLRGVDRSKDQSYFLYAMNQLELASTLFPVGSFTKTEVRSIAREAGLSAADKAESQDICFVSGSVQDFVAKRITKERSGLIRRVTGEIIGTHDGIHRFTVGQRRGLSIGGGHGSPLYVLSIDSESATVYVGEKIELNRQNFLVKQVSWVRDSSTPREMLVQVRHRNKAVPAQISQEDEATFKVTFLSELAVVAPGQAAVFYDLTDEELLGGGRISNSRAISRSICSGNYYQAESVVNN